MPPRVRLFGTRLSPFVEKVARGLAYKRLAFEVVAPRGLRDFRRWNPQTGKMPVLEIDGTRIYDSTFILRRLDELVPAPPLRAADPAAAAAQALLEDWADESLYWYGMALRWTPANADRTARQIFALLPAPMRPLARVIGSRRIRAMVRAQGLGRLPQEVLVAELGGLLAHLVRILGDRPFFYADRPSAADLAIYGQCHMLTSGPTPDAARCVAAQPALEAYLARVRAATGG